MFLATPWFQNVVDEIQVPACRGVGEMTVAGRKGVDGMVKTRMKSS